MELYLSDTDYMKVTEPDFNEACLYLSEHTKTTFSDITTYTHRGTTNPFCVHLTKCDEYLMVKELFLYLEEYR